MVITQIKEAFTDFNFHLWQGAEGVMRGMCVMTTNTLGAGCQNFRSGNQKVKSEIKTRKEMTPPSLVTRFPLRSIVTCPLSLSRGHFTTCPSTEAHTR